MQNTAIRIGPISLSSTLTTNLINPKITSLAGPVGLTLAQPYLILYHVRVINRTGTNATVSYWVGATRANAAGTEAFFNGAIVPPNSTIEEYGRFVMRDTDFLVGGAGTASVLSAIFDGEIGFQSM